MNAEKTFQSSKISFLNETVEILKRRTNISVVIVSLDFDYVWKKTLQGKHLKGHFQASRISKFFWWSMPPNPPKS